MTDINNNAKNLSINIPIFFIQKALSSVFLWAPVWVIYLQQYRQISLAEIGLLEAAFAITWILCEVPTGAFADLYGRKQSLIIGHTLYTVGILGFGLAPNFPLLALAYITWSIGFTFLSGSGTALLYDTLKSMGREDEYAKILGRSSSLRHSMYAISGLIGAPLAAIDLSWPILISALFGFLSVVAVFFFKEPPKIQPVSSTQWSAYWVVMKESLLQNIIQGPLRSVFLYGTGIMLVCSLLNFLIQPFLVEQGVPIAMLGVVFFAFSMFRVIGGFLVPRILKHVKENALIFIFPIIIVCLLIPLWTLPIAFIIFSLIAMEFVFAIFEPFIGAKIQRATPDNLRATVGSFYSLFEHAFLIPLQPLSGWVVDRFGFSRALLAMTLGFAGFIMPITKRFKIVSKTLNSSEEP